MNSGLLSEWEQNSFSVAAGYRDDYHEIFKKYAKRMEGLRDGFVYKSHWKVS